MKRLLVKNGPIRVFDKSHSLINENSSPRAKAFSVIGLYHYYKKYNQEEILSKIKSLVDTLVESYKREATEEWNWFESYLTYSNSKIPEMLFLAYNLTKNKEYLEIAEKSLNFLTKLVFFKDELSPIGQNGWYNRNGVRSFFDQQPIDASSMVQTYLIAYSMSRVRHEPSPEHTRRCTGMAFREARGIQGL